MIGFTILEKTLLHLVLGGFHIDFIDIVKIVTVTIADLWYTVGTQMWYILHFVATVSTIIIIRTSLRRIQDTPYFENKKHNEKGSTVNQYVHHVVLPIINIITVSLQLSDISFRIDFSLSQLRNNETTTATTIVSQNNDMTLLLQILFGVYAFCLIYSMWPISRWMIMKHQIMQNRFDALFSRMQLCDIIPHFYILSTLIISYSIVETKYRVYTLLIINTLLVVGLH